MTKKGIDVSTHQGVINWNNVKNDGIEFAILRIGYGSRESQKDAQFENNYNGAKSVGIPVGVYLYSYAQNTSEAKAEAETCIKWLNNRHLDLPVYYDVEDKIQENVDKNTLTNMCIAFCDTIEKAGYWAGIYTNKSWAMNKVNGHELGKRYTYWVAQYNNECTYTGSYDMWQYTSSGYVNGINGRVDMNYLYKDLGGSTNDSSSSVSSEKVDQVLHVGSKVELRGIYKITSVSARLNAVACKELADQPFADYNYIDATPCVEVDRYGNRTADQVCDTGHYIKIPGVFTVLAIDKPTDACKIKIGSREVWVKCGPCTEV